MYLTDNASIILTKFRILPHVVQSLGHFRYDRFALTCRLPNHSPIEIPPQKPIPTPR